MNNKRDRHGQHIYGWVHQNERKRWVRRVEAGGVVCWRCGKPIPPGSKFDLGHVDEDGRARGFPTRAAEHRACNRATISILKRKLAEAESASSTSSREW